MARMNILVLEDDLEMHTYYRTKFDKSFVFKFVTEASEFLDLLTFHKWDAAFVDINLGDHKMDGLKVIKEVRDQLKLILPMIVVSRYPDQEKIAHALECGADDYVTKPLDVELLNAKLHYLLSETSAEFDTLRMSRVPNGKGAGKLALNFEVFSVNEFGLVIQSESYIAKSTHLTLKGAVMKEIFDDGTMKFVVQTTEVLNGLFKIHLGFFDKHEENSVKAKNWIISQSNQGIE
jgi:DNA-binding response OmpR family regulator